jgi:selenocysteine-specific translation elongation factor
LGTPPDGELALLLDAFGIPGVIEILDSNVDEETARVSFKGLSLSNFLVEKRDSKSSFIDLSRVQSKESRKIKGTMVYIDRAFNVKGVGVVVLGFILAGDVSVHDKLRLIPSTGESRYAEVKGIQVSDEDYDSAGRGIRVGLSLKGVELKDFSKTVWMDDGSSNLSKELMIKFKPTPFYNQSVLDRDMHIQMPGEIALCRVRKGKANDEITASIPFVAPIWENMRVCIIDLNAKNLRVAGAGEISV